MPRSAIPDWGQEYPEYEYKAWPKYVGMSAEGEALIAKNKEEFEAMKADAVYPKVLGKDRHGNELIAQNPRDEEWLKAKVIHKAIDNAEPSDNTLTGDPAKRPYHRKAVA